MAPESKPSSNPHDTQVGPHEFSPLRWRDARRRWNLGRCRACYLPSRDHPVRGWTTARPYGDKRLVP